MKVSPGMKVIHKKKMGLANPYNLTRMRSSEVEKRCRKKVKDK
jgi:hypothetical protein